jgi:RNA polymerase sigma-70 factor (ECF subfamily)
VNPVAQDRPLNLSLSKTGSGEELPRPTEETFHAVFIRFSRPVLSFIHSMLHDHSQAEDLCQETFVRAFRKLDAKNESTTLSTWIFGIASNVVRESVKRKYTSLQRTAPFSPPVDGIDAAAVPPDQQLISAELRDRIRDALWRLTEDQRLVAVLKLIHKMKYEEIAYITGSSVAKLKTDLHRARMEMRQNLHPYLHGDSA